MLRSRSRPFPALVLALALLAPPSFGGTVRVLDATGSQSFLAIQPAVDAADDGDVLLVAGGVYAGFTITAKSLTVLGDPGANVVVDGAVVVTGETPGGVVLAGLKLQSSGFPALRVQSGSDVWVRGCELLGRDGVGFGTDGTTGAQVTTADVVFDACSIRGGSGADNPNSFGFAGNGRPGVTASSQARVALYGCAVVGGDGGDGDERGGSGATACSAAGAGFVHAAQSSFSGGDGGVGMFGPCGGGGHGLSAPAGSLAVDGSYAGGSHGCGGIGGSPTTGAITFLSGARDFDAAPASSDAAAWNVTVAGQPGDRAFLVGAVLPAFRPVPSQAGVRLVPTPAPVSVVPLGTVGAGGTLSVPVALGALPAGVPLRRLFLQGLVIDAQGATKLASPLPLVVLNADEAPDCDGDGLQDYLAVLGPSAGVDANNNLVPDACDAFGPVWYVDDGAPPGGNGSQASPFRTLGQAFASAASGHVIRVADGVYTGPENRELDFAGRALVVESENGPAACLIDLQRQGRAFRFRSGEPPQAVLRGFSIANGEAPSEGSTVSGGGIDVRNASPTIEHCVVLGCHSLLKGGGIALLNSNATVRWSTLAGNSAHHGLLGFVADGGGIWISGGNPSLHGLWIEGNHAEQTGGGVYMTAGALSHSIVRENDAKAGAGLYVDNHAVPVRLDDLLIAGNVASSHSGGLTKRGPTVVRLSNSTLVANRAPFASVALAHGTNASTARFELRNTVVWGNVDDQGPGLTFVVNGQDTLDVAWCDIEGGASSVQVTPGQGGTLVWGPGNLQVDPLFVDPVGPDNDPFTVFDNDYRLGAGSPCVDAGDVFAVPADALDLDFDLDVVEPVPIALDGAPRFVDVASAPDTGNGPAPVVDIGCYEQP